MCDKTTRNKPLFDDLAERYDAWFDSEKGRVIFDAELRCLKKTAEGLARPWFEVGVGTGRFAEALQIEAGADTSEKVLEYAEKRGIAVYHAPGESLPCQINPFGAVFLVVSICFVDDPLRVLLESKRIMLDSGRILIGLVPADSPWGRHYRRQAAEGHPFYSTATFYTTAQVIELAERAGMELESASSTLLQGPDQSHFEPEDAHDEIVDHAGFVVLRFKNKGEEPIT